MPLLTAQDLSKTYRVYQKKPGLAGALRGLFHREHKEVKAVAGVTFSVEPGEMVAFLGPNGAGKTTTLKMLAGLIYPSTGTASVMGFTPWDRVDAFRRQFSLVMGQKNQLWWDLPAADSFQLHREIYSLTKADCDQTIGELTELFGVKELTKQPVRELSLGERMKMELIAALLHRPRLLLLDEPTIGLDVIAQVKIQECLREYNRSRGVTMLLTSHYMRDVEALCKRVLVINHGMLVYDGDLAGIVEEFGQEKLLRLQFRDQVPTTLSDFGTVLSTTGPTVEMRVNRVRVAQILSQLLEQFAVVDVSVQDPPLEQMIAQVFAQAKQT